MVSDHRFQFKDAARMDDIAPDSVHLVVTSPPYPMIEMWDPLFRQNTSIDAALKREKGTEAFEAMHRELDRVWLELYRVLVPGGIVCINIGDATRTVDGEFALFPNHSRIQKQMVRLGFTNLPAILWRKQTNAPNKFMGSGMMPPGAYVTLEHEFILIFRKGGKRLFKSEQAKRNRRQSAFFWEERNHWFSDVWMDLKGTRQDTADRKLRQRSGAYPYELAYRLICMFSTMGDTVLDPFLGTGTTLFAAAATNRNSVGVELDEAFRPVIAAGMKAAVERGRGRIAERFAAHNQFVNDRKAAGKAIKYINRWYGFPVVTRQETELCLPLPAESSQEALDHWRVAYEHPTRPQPGAHESDKIAAMPKKTGQMKLFD